MKEVLGRYVRREIDLTSAIIQLGIKRSQFFLLLAEFRKNAAAFSVARQRETPKRISENAEALIVK